MDDHLPIDNDAFREELLGGPKAFKDAHDAFHWAEDVSLKFGFDVSIYHSDLKPGRDATGKLNKLRMDIRCFKSGKYEPTGANAGTEQSGDDAPKTRKTTTKKTDCEFFLRLRYNRDNPDAPWYWGNNLYAHNHDQIPLSAIPSARRFSICQLLQIAELSDANVKPRFIANLLRQKDPDAVFNPRDVYNAQRAIKERFLDGRTPSQAFLDFLEANGYYYDYQMKNGRITRVFWMHPESLMLLAAFSTVQVLDNTYKTNKYLMPLLDWVGTPSTGQTFVVCNALLSGEAQEDYAWAFDRMKDHLSVELGGFVLGRQTSNGERV